MSQTILRALMQLFAIVANSADDPSSARSVVEVYLRQFLSSDLVAEYLKLYEEFFSKQNISTDGEKRQRRLAVSSVRVVVICEQINAELDQKQKFLVLLHLLEFIYMSRVPSEQELEFVQTVSDSFKLPEMELEQCKQMVGSDQPHEEIHAGNLLYIAEEPPLQDVGNYLQCSHMQGSLVVLRIASVGIYLIRQLGSGELLLNSQSVVPGKVYVFSPGSSIKGSKIQTIYYSDVLACFFNDRQQDGVRFRVDNIRYVFRNGRVGLQPISFTENSGKLVGIMGGSGAGKSTLLNILNGNNAPTSGQVTINGIDLHRNKKQLEGVIGYIPQDDLLIEELTVFQNLYYSSRLCFADKSPRETIQLVNAMLLSLGLSEAAHLKVGNPLEQIISGGQRKRLNIALELIREPSILFVDEPTSGLSSRDSENIMDLLKELALRGKLVFVVIHQPSSDIFKLFDKLFLLDQGGYPIYYGNPVESLVYFKSQVNHVNAAESVCMTCGSVNPEQLFNIIETKILDEDGNQTRRRKISPKEWNAHYLQYGQQPLTNESQILPPPGKGAYKKPNFMAQLRVFLTRNVLSKLADMQYLLINLLEAPVLALVLAGLIKYYKSDGTYLLSGNKNIPAYIFMCVIVSLFIGLTVSAEEIIRDRKILKRESFLNLSKGSYLLSKILVLFFISAFQTASFIWIGNSILGIRHLFFDYWLVLFSASCFSNLLGLNISASLKSVVTIYILIPFLLIPQILLSGVIVKFEELNPMISSRSVVPFAGDVFVSRWAFEALAVNQFMENEYEKELYPFEKAMSNATYKKVYWAEKLDDLLSKSKKDPSLLELVKQAVREEQRQDPSIQCVVLDQLENYWTDAAVADGWKRYMGNLKKKYSKLYEEAQNKKDDWVLHYQAQGNLDELEQQNQNAQLADLVKNSASDSDPVVVEGGRLYPTADAVYHDGSREQWIRAHFFAPSKNFFGKQLSTYRVNLLVIWAMIFVLAISLYFDLFKFLFKLPGFFSNRLKKN